MFILFQSTHLREVRLDDVIDHVYTFKFQSTHLREVRQHAARDNIIPKMFQSTHLREVRRCRYGRRPRPRSRFNPRTCVRCDRGGVGVTAMSQRFQSTHLREVRRSSWWSCVARCCFNPRTCVRCDGSLWQ